LHQSGPQDSQEGKYYQQLQEVIQRNRQAGEEISPGAITIRQLRSSG
jgi:hypothetical protein